MVKDWDGFMGGSRFKSQCGQHMENKNNTCQKKGPKKGPKKKKIQVKYVDLEGK